MYAVAARALAQSHNSKSETIYVDTDVIDSKIKKRANSGFYNLYLTTPEYTSIELAKIYLVIMDIYGSKGYKVSWVEDVYYTSPFTEDIIVSIKIDWSISWYDKLLRWFYN